MWNIDFVCKFQDLNTTEHSLILPVKWSFELLAGILGKWQSKKTRLFTTDRRVCGWKPCILVNSYTTEIDFDKHD